jgi:hypothetical protein
MANATLYYSKKQGLLLRDGTATNKYWRCVPKKFTAKFYLNPCEKAKLKQGGSMVELSNILFWEMAVQILAGTIIIIYRFLVCCSFMNCNLFVYNSLFESPLTYSCH